MPKKIDQQVFRATRSQRRILTAFIILLSIFPLVAICYLIFR